MFNNLFGAKPKEAPKIDTDKATAHIRSQVENIDMRLKKLEHEAGELRNQAKALGKTGNPADRNRAMQKIKLSNMRQKEIAKLEGQQFMLEQQINMVDSSKFDQTVYEAINTGTQMVDQTRVKYDVDQIQDIQDKMMEQQADADEIANVAAQFGQEGNEEAADMLDQLLAEDAMAEMDTIPMAGVGAIGGGAIAQPQQPAAKKVDKVAADEDDLAQMMAL